jgi:hypothetical protein
MVEQRETEMRGGDLIDGSLGKVARLVLDLILVFVLSGNKERWSSSSSLSLGEVRFGRKDLANLLGDVLMILCLSCKGLVALSERGLEFSGSLVVDSTDSTLEILGKEATDDIVRF